MEYHRLTTAQVEGIYHRKQLELEAAHARLSLDVRLAETSTRNADQIIALRTDLALVARQLDLLEQWLSPEPQITPEAETSEGPPPRKSRRSLANGQRDDTAVAL